jgi:hypothetical protein
MHFDEIIRLSVGADLSAFGGFWVVTLLRGDRNTSR